MHNKKCQTHTIITNTTCLITAYDTTNNDTLFHMQYGHSVSLLTECSSDIVLTHDNREISQHTNEEDNQEITNTCMGDEPK